MYINMSKSKNLKLLTLVLVSYYYIREMDKIAQIIKIMMALGCSEYIVETNDSSNTFNCVIKVVQPKSSIWEFSEEYLIVETIDGVYSIWEHRIKSIKAADPKYRNIMKSPLMKLLS